MRRHPDRQAPTKEKVRPRIKRPKRDAALRRGKRKRRSA